MKPFVWTADQEQADEPQWLTDLINDGRVNFSDIATPEVKMHLAGVEVAQNASLSHEDGVVKIDDAGMVTLVFLSGDKVTLNDLVEACGDVAEKIVHDARTQLDRVTIVGAEVGEEQTSVTMEVKK